MDSKKNALYQTLLILHKEEYRQIEEIGFIKMFLDHLDNVPSPYFITFIKNYLKYSDAFSIKVIEQKREGNIILNSRQGRKPSYYIKKRIKIYNIDLDLLGLEIQKLNKDVI